MPANVLNLLTKSLFSFHPSRPKSTEFSTIDEYQKLVVLVSLLFTLFTKIPLGSYTISWLEYRQTILLMLPNFYGFYCVQHCNNVHCSSVPM